LRAGGSARALGHDPERGPLFRQRRVWVTPFELGHEGADQLDLTDAQRTFGAL
jgi:hypothetical protein